MMDIKKRPLIHNPQCFDRDTLLQRQESLKFKNLARMELFLWDLEIFLQIQENLKDKVVLKGGAAAQFGIPGTPYLILDSGEFLGSGQRETSSNNSVDMKGDRAIRKGLCGHQPALRLPRIGDFPGCSGQPSGNKPG